MLSSQNNIKLDKVKQKDSQKKTMLERRWSAIASATSLRRKRRESFIYQPNESFNSPKVDFVRVSKSEYEEIKSRVSAIEKRLSLELDSIETTVLHKEVNIITNIQSAYEQTLEQAEPLSPGTDQLARRLSRELRIRNSSEKIIRSPSARKIGTIRRRSRESERPSKISKINSVQNVSNGMPMTNFSRRDGDKQLKLHFDSMSSNNSGNSFEFNSDMGSRDFNFSPKVRGIKRSSSSTTYNYSPLKDRPNQFGNRRSLELVPLNNSNKENDLVTRNKVCTPKMPQIKRSIPVSRTPKRLCTTPCSSRINTPLRVVNTPIRVVNTPLRVPNNFKLKS